MISGTIHLSVTLVQGVSEVAVAPGDRRLRAAPRRYRALRHVCVSSPQLPATPASADQRREALPWHSHRYQVLAEAWRDRR